MDFKKNRLAIASVALVVLVGGLYLANKNREEDFSGSASPTPSIPDISADAIREIAITRPGQATIKLTKTGDAFRVTAPVQAATDNGSITTLIEKLTSLEVVSVAATNAANHATLEVDDAHAIRVVVSGASGKIVELRIGAFRGGNTMVRVDASNDVLAVEGSIKFAFNRELREWRDRAIVTTEASSIRAISIAGDQGTFSFVRNASDAWTVAEGQPAIERMSTQKIETLVGALAHLRANDFAAEGAATGLATPRSTVTLTVRTAQAGDVPETNEQIVLLLGAPVAEGGDAYVQRRGNPLVYTVASYAADRMRPALAAFQEDVVPDGGVPPAPPPEMPQMGGPGGQQIPPELLEQLQRQMGGGGHP